MFSVDFFEVLSLFELLVSPLADEEPVLLLPDALPEPAAEPPDVLFELCSEPPVVVFELPEELALPELLPDDEPDEDEE